MFDSAAQLLQPIRSTPQKFFSNTKEVQKMVQAFLFNQNFFVPNQSSMIKSFDSNSSQKQILQGEIQLLILIIKHLKHIYSRKQLENKNLEMHLEYYKNMLRQQKQVKNKDLNTKRYPEKFQEKLLLQKSTLKKQETKPTYFQSIQSSVSCFQREERIVRSFNSKQEERQNKFESQLIRQNKQLKECLEERDQKISDLTLQNDKLRVSFKKSFQQLKALAIDKEQLIIDQNILLMKVKNQKSEFQFQIQNLKNQRDFLKDNLKKLQSKLESQSERADYKEQCQFLRSCFKKQLDNNYQLNSSKIKLLRKIDKLQKTIKINQNKKITQKFDQTKANQKNSKKLKFYQNLPNQANKQSNCMQKQYIQIQTDKKNIEESMGDEFGQKSKKFKKSSQAYVMVQRKQQIKSEKLKFQNLINKFSLQSEEQKNVNQKLQFLLQKLMEYSIKVQELTKSSQLTKIQNNKLKQQLKKRDVQKCQQMNQLKLFFQKQLESAKKKLNNQNNTELLSIISQNKKNQVNDNFREEDLVEQDFKNIEIKQIYNSYYEVLQQKIKDKTNQNQLLIKKLKQQEEFIQILQTKELKINLHSLTQNSLMENTLKRTILTQRKKVTIRYQNPYQEVHEHESIKIQSNQSESNLYYNKNKEIQNKSKGLIYNPYVLDNFNVFRCKLTQFYQNVINELQYWQNMEVNHKNDLILSQNQKREGNLESKQQRSIQPKSQQIASSQDMEVTFNFQVAIENILTQKMKQFQAFSQNLSINKQKLHQQHIFQELKSCNSQYQSQSQDIYDLQENERQHKQQSQLFGDIFKPNNSCTNNIDRFQNENEQRMNNQSENGYLSKLFFVENSLFEPK